MYKLYFAIVFLLFAISSTSAQKHVNYKANLAEFDKYIAPDAWRLIGNVIFKDRSATMYCDSAYFYEKTEDIDAFGNIRIIPDKDNTTLTGKILHYKAEERVANITGNVVLVDDSATLTTQSIFYNMNTGVAFYPTKGTIVSDSMTIVSNQGSYDKNIKEFYFKKNVIITNPGYTIHTDTMNYNTVSKIVDFLGPTMVVTNENDSMYCEKGWYNTGNDIASFRQRAWWKGDGRTVKGDTLYYEKHTGLGEAYGNIEMVDTSSNIIIRGNYAIYNRFKQNALVTKKALMIQVDKDKEDSLYLHADTIYSGIFTEVTKKTLEKKVERDLSDLQTEHSKGIPEVEKNPTISVVNKKDSLNHQIDTVKYVTLPEKSDSSSFETSTIDTFKFVTAYHHVKFYRTDIQGKCDSLYYSFKDSTLQFIGKPVLWANDYQLKAEHAKIFIKNQKMERMELTSQSFIISQEDSIRFNQIKGRNMTGYFINNELYKMLVKGNGQSIYFSKDEGLLIGVQKSESSDITMFFKQRKPTRITYKNAVSGVIHPPFELSGNDLLLKDFEWLEKHRPRKWQDVFIW